MQIVSRQPSRVFPHRSGHNGIVITGNNVHRPIETGQSIRGFLNQGSFDAVVLEEVAGHNEKFGLSSHRHFDHAVSGGEPFCSNPGTGLSQPFSLHSDLPVGSVNKLHRWTPVVAQAALFIIYYTVCL